MLSSAPPGSPSLRCDSTPRPHRGFPASPAPMTATLWSPPNLGPAAGPAHEAGACTLWAGPGSGAACQQPGRCGCWPQVPRLPSTMLLLNLAAADPLLALSAAVAREIAYHLRGPALASSARPLPPGHGRARPGHPYGSLLLPGRQPGPLPGRGAPLRPHPARPAPGQRAQGHSLAAAAALAMPWRCRQQTFLGCRASDHVLCHDVLPTGAQATGGPPLICLAGFGCFLPLLAMVLSYGATPAHAGSWGPALRPRRCG